MKKLIQSFLAAAGILSLSSCAHHDHDRDDDDDDHGHRHPHAATTTTVTEETTISRPMSGAVETQIRRY